MVDAANFAAVLVIDTIDHADGLGNHKVAPHHADFGAVHGRVGQAHRQFGL